MPGNKQPRVKFRCQKCSGRGDLSHKYFQSRVKMGLPLYCAPCRDWANHQRSGGLSGSITEGEKAVRRRESISVNGCVLVATDGGRCDRYYECPDGDGCLNVAAARNWSGWRREEGHA